MQKRRTRRSDENLRDRLAEIAAETGPASPEPRGVLARGDRRRTGAAVGVATLTFLAALTGVGFAAGMGLNHWFTKAPAASSLTGQSAGEFPSEAATPPQSETPSSAPLPSPSPAASRPRSPAPNPNQVPDPTKIPASLKMLHEGEAGWTTSKDANVASAFNPCAGADGTVAGRTDARTLKGPGLPGEESHSPAKVTHQLFIYATEEAATAAFVKLGAGGCGWDRSVMNPGDAESTHLARFRKQEPYQPNVYWLHDANLVRTKNALLIAYADTSGSGMTSNLADQELNRILKPLCDAKIVCR